MGHARILPLFVIPAQAGIRRAGVGMEPLGLRLWIPACAGMTLVMRDGTPPAEAGIHGSWTRMVLADVGYAVAGAARSPEDDYRRERVRGVLIAAW
jgi:hypothetical protein